MHVNKPVSLQRLRACPCPKARVELLVAARAPWTPRANLTKTSSSFPAQALLKTSPTGTFSTPKLQSGPILLTPSPLHTHIRTRAVIHLTGQSQASTTSHSIFRWSARVCVCVYVSWEEDTRKLSCNYRSSRAQTLNWHNFLFGDPWIDSQNVNLAKWKRQLNKIGTELIVCSLNYFYSKEIIFCHILFLISGDILFQLFCPKSEVRSKYKHT